MKEYHPPLGNRDAMRLDFNENTVACSPRVREVLGRISAGDLTRYPERAPVERIVAHHLGVAPEQVVLTNGVDEAIHVLFETFLEAGDELLLPVPTYTMYEVYASATDARAVTVQAAADLQFPFERLLNAISLRTKIIAIANPNSPSGSIATREQIIEIAQRAPQAVVLVDEAYFHFYGETVLDLIGTMPNVVVARTFFQGVWAGGVAARSSGGAGGTDAVDAARAFAIQREFAGPGLFAPRTGGCKLSGLVCRGSGCGADGVRNRTGRGRRAPVAKSREFYPGRNRRKACRVCAADVGRWSAGARPFK